MAYRIFKLLHLLGLALFLGSIFDHIVSSLLGGAVGGTAAFVAARTHIALASAALTLPGLYLSLATGIAMVLAKRLNPLQVRWLLVHGGIGFALLGSSLLIVMPAVSAALSGAQELLRGAGDLNAVMAAKQTEDAVGGANVLLTMLAIGVAVWKPRLGRVSG